MEYSHFNKNKNSLISQYMKIHHQLSNYCYETILIIKIYAPSICLNTVQLHIGLPNGYYFQAETYKCGLLF